MSKPNYYRETKRSNAGWIGNVPNHWELLPSRTVVSNQTLKNEGGKDQNYLSLVAGKGVLLYADKGEMGNKKPDDLAKCKIVSEGNLVINSMNYFIGSYGMSPYNGVCSPVYIVLDVKTQKMERRFALRVFSDRGLQKYLATFGNGILEHRAAIGWDDIKGAYLPVPPLDEQKQIAVFLDYETAKIDALIEKQQRLITLLGEKRQAVISHAVTKGLNPDVPMRDSGIEWLGEVPEHWVVCALGKLTLDKCDGPFGSGLKSEHYTASGVRVIRLQNIKKNRYFTGEDVFIDQTYYETKLSDHTVLEGDLLIAGLGDGNNPVGRACVAPLGIEPAMVKADCFRFRLDAKKLNSHFIAYQLSSSSEYASGAMSNGSTRSRIPLSVTATRYIAYAPLDEQQEIVSYLKGVQASFAKLESTAILMNQRLQERRTALISAAVTGKIDVRNWKSSSSGSKPKTKKKVT